MPSEVAKPINAKCRYMLANDNYDTYINEGGIRSTKTTLSNFKFMRNVIKSGPGNYLITATSLDAIEANMLKGDKFSILRLFPQFKVVDKNELVCGDRTIYLVGASNRSDWQRIRGRTIRGWYADEVNLCPTSFIDEALNRMTQESRRLKIWTLNPVEQTHAIYEDYIDLWRKVEPQRTLYTHFNLLDNPIMTIDDVIREKQLRSTASFNRYILGLRGNTEGMIYIDFKPQDHIITDASKYKFMRFAIGVDFGESKSDNVFTLVGFTEGWNEVIILDELNLKGSTTYDAVADEYRKFVTKAKQKYNVTCAYMDKANPGRIEFMPKGLGVVHERSLKKPIFDRIMWTNTLFKLNRLYVMNHCKKTINAFQSAVWDKNGKRLDDGSYGVDNLDAFEYAFEPFVKYLRLV